jgi:amidohydrolase
MDSKIHQTIDALVPELVTLRHELHRHPEIRFEERWTSERIARYLGEAGIPHTRGHAGGTGIVATIAGGRPGGAVALRADMDALEIEEQTGLPYASEIPERMHACGHDGHTAMLCGAARALWTHRDTLPGTVKLIFQPAEEQAAGGRYIVNEGLLDDVQAAFALHCWPDLSVGTAACGDGRVMASADYFCVDVRGRGGHGADPSAAIDPVLVAAHIITALQSIVSREVHPWDTAVVNVACMEAGHASNVIPEWASIEGTYRALSADVRERVRRAIERIAMNTAAAFGATATVDLGEDGYPVLENDPKMAALARAALGDALGAAQVPPVTHPYMTAEDFAYYLQRVPGAFIFLGNRPADVPAGQAPTLHSPHFNFNDDALPHGVRALCAVATRFLAG